MRLAIFFSTAAAMVGLGCSFDGSGPGGLSAADLGVETAVPPRDGPHGTSDVANEAGVDGRVDGSLPDGIEDATPDSAVDTLSPDSAVDTLSPDSTEDTLPAVLPITSASLGAALRAETVECIDNNGNVAGGDIAAADDTTVVFYDGSVTLAAAPQETLTWVGGRSAICVRYNLNSCGDEWIGGGDWSSTGLLIRGAQLVSGELVLDPTTSEADIDLIDIRSDGTFETTYDPCGADDSTLPPQLVQPVGAAKRVILQLGGL